MGTVSFSVKMIIRIHSSSFTSTLGFLSGFTLIKAGKLYTGSVYIFNRK
jgi:hypothetical protein